MSDNRFVASNVRLVSDPKTKTIKVKGQEKSLIEITFADNAWNEKRFGTKFITATFAAGSRNGDKAAALRKGSVILTISGRLDFRTYEAGEGRKKETRVAFEIQYPELFEVAKATAPVEETAPADDVPADDAPAGEGESGEAMPWDQE